MHTLMPFWNAIKRLILVYFILFQFFTATTNFFYFPLVDIVDIFVDIFTRAVEKIQIQISQQKITLNSRKEKV